ncbi:hypothetical protein B0H13DRAFT_1902263 [Mycena leptocephala]|nr:hypothetical protein B0H13DRAFT_1902263 [Mycena leptocephala]
MPLTTNNSTTHSRLLNALRQGEISRSLAETDTPSLAVVALAQLSDKDRRRVEQYLLLADREPTQPPKKRAAPATTGSSASSGNRTKGGGAHGGRASVKLLCWFKAGCDPRELDGFVENDLTSLEPHAGRLPTDIEMYHKERKEWKWIPVCLKTPIPRRRGVKVLFFRKKGLTDLIMIVTRTEVDHHLLQQNIVSANRRRLVFNHLRRAADRNARWDEHSTNLLVESWIRPTVNDVETIKVVFACDSCSTSAPHSH